MIDVTKREMRRAFSLHVESAGNASNLSERLLLIYAAETGLKALLMDQRKANIASQLPLIAELGHDLRGLLKELRARPTITVRVTRTIQKVPQHVECRSLHQAFRYGVELEDGDSVVLDLKAVCDWIRERMR